MYDAQFEKLLSEDAPSPRQAAEGSRRTGATVGTAEVATTGNVGFPQEGRHMFPELEGFGAGVETGSDACNSVASVLRMLFLSDLRNLQDEVNGVIALAQSSRTAAAE